MEDAVSFLEGQKEYKKHLKELATDLEIKMLAARDFFDSAKKKYKEAQMEFTKAKHELTKKRKAFETLYEIDYKEHILARPGGKDYQISFEHFESAKKLKIEAIEEPSSGVRDPNDVDDILYGA